MTPSIGLQIPIAVFVASVLKGNKISASIGVWITNPITSPFIYSVTYMLGKKVLGIAQSPQLPSELSIGAILEIISKTPEVLGVLMIGGIVV